MSVYVETWHAASPVMGIQTYHVIVDYLDTNGKRRGMPRLYISDGVNQCPDNGMLIEFP